MGRRGRPSSPPSASPPDNDDLLSEIPLRLPPAPSSLPRASLVCKRWRRLVKDRAFLRRGAPLLGFFIEGRRGRLFKPTLEPPDRLPRGCFSLETADADEWRILGCRHGLVLLLHSEQIQVLVWDPITDEQRRIAVSPGFLTRVGTLVSNGAVLRAAGDVHGGTQSSTFQVVLLGDDPGLTRAFVCVYSSENGVWRDPISVACPGTFVTRIPSAFVGCSLYWYLIGDSPAILEFDLDRQHLALIDMPVQEPPIVWVIPADGGALGFLYLSNHNVYLWKRTTDDDGVAGWVLGRTIKLDSLLPLAPGEAWYLRIYGFSEDEKMLIIGAIDYIFTIQLDSMKFVQFNIHIASLNSSICHPFSSVYTAGI